MNLLALIALLFMIFKMVEGYKNGMVKEIISFVSLLISSVVVVLIGSGFRSYREKQMMGVVVAILLLAIIGILRHLLGVVFFSAKMIVKLPIVSWVDKVLGIVVGSLEVIVLLWVVYTFVMYYGLGMVGEQIILYTKASKFLTVVYEHNYLALLVENVIGKLPVA